MSTPDSKAKPLVLLIPKTGERFEFLSSARGSEGVFRFRWTLDPGKKGPPPHRHEHESETFSIADGTMLIWVDGVEHRVVTGDEITVQPGQTHRFFNDGSEPVVVDVCLDGALQEEVLLSMVHMLEERGGISGMEAFRHFLWSVRQGAISTPLPAIDGMLRAIAFLLRVPDYSALRDWERAAGGEYVL